MLGDVLEKCNDGSANVIDIVDGVFRVKRQERQDPLEHLEDDLAALLGGWAFDLSHRIVDGVIDRFGDGRVDLCDPGERVAGRALDDLLEREPEGDDDVEAPLRTGVHPDCAVNYVEVAVNERGHSAAPWTVRRVVGHRDVGRPLDVDAALRLKCQTASKAVGWHQRHMRRLGLTPVLCRSFKQTDWH